MAHGRNKERAAPGEAGVTAPPEEGREKGEGTKRRLAAIVAALEDIAYGQELILARIQALSEELAEQKRLVEKLTNGSANRPSVTAEAAPVSPARLFSTIVPDLHNPDSGRLDAKRVSDTFGITLSRLSRVLGRNLSTVSKTPDAEALQDRLVAFERIATALQQLGWSLDRIRIWTKTPAPLSDGRTPGDLISEGLAVVLAQRLEDLVEAGAE